MVVPISSFILEKNLIVLADGCHEYDACDVLEAVNPFLSFVSLSTHIEHFECISVDCKFRLYDSRGTHATAQHVLFTGKIVVFGNIVNSLEEI